MSEGYECSQGDPTIPQCHRIHYNMSTDLHPLKLLSQTTQVTHFHKTGQALYQNYISYKQYDY